MTAAPPEQPGRYQRSATGMVGAMVVLVVLVGGFVGVQALGRDHDVEPAQTVDYRPVADQARTAGTLFDLVAPDLAARGVARHDRELRAGPCPDLAPRGAHRPGLATSASSSRWPRSRTMVEEFVDPDAERGDDGATVAG